jgi:hypothetical protein
MEKRFVELALGPEELLLECAFQYLDRRVFRILFCQSFQVSYTPVRSGTRRMAELTVLTFHVESHPLGNVGHDFQ